MNKEILQLALTGIVQLELEYREPSSNQTGRTREPAAAQKRQPAHAWMAIADAPAFRVLS